jgi:hypothetical protein
MGRDWILLSLHLQPGKRFTCNTAWFVLFRFGEASKYPGRYACCHAAWRDIASHNAARANDCIVADADAFEYSHSRAKPRSILYDDWAGFWKLQLILNIVVVIVEDEDVMAEVAGTPDGHSPVRGNRSAEIYEGFIANFDDATRLGQQLYWRDIAVHDHALSKHDLAAALHTCSSAESYRWGNSRNARQAQLCV